MTREIKFRVYDRDNRSFLEGRDKAEILAMFVSGALEDPENYGIDQFTGLGTRNGIEIYDKDFLKGFDEEEGVHLVQWDKDFACFDARKLMTNGSLSFVNMLYELSGECEVIGNLYENQELLEKK